MLNRRTTRPTGRLVAKAGRLGSVTAFAYSSLMPLQRIALVAAPPRRALVRLAIGASLAIASSALAVDLGDGRRAERSEMVDQQIIRRGVTDPRLIAAFLAVPRHRFVPPEWQAQAYADGPLPIGEGQTISQPYVVAKMTELARLGPSDRVFELGTGSGYQAAIASRLCANVFTVEIHALLAERAAQVLDDLGYRNVSVRAGDGFRGWPEAAPFDAMLITAAVPEIPESLLKQLKAGGRAVLPVGPALGLQDLVLVEKAADGKTITKKIFPVRFVPATGTP